VLKIQAQNADADFNPFLVNMGCPTKEFLNFLKTFPRPKKVHDIKKVQAIVPVVPAQGLSAMVAFFGQFFVCRTFASGISRTSFLGCSGFLRISLDS
jgi:hypothetical protein